MKGLSFYMHLIFLCKIAVANDNKRLRFGKHELERIFRPLNIRPSSAGLSTVFRAVRVGDVNLALQNKERIDGIGLVVEIDVTGFSV